MINPGVREAPSARKPLTLNQEIQAQHEDLETMGVAVSGVYADLLNASLSEVNWLEIAEHFIEDCDHD